MYVSKETPCRSVVIDNIAIFFCGTPAARESSYFFMGNREFKFRVWVPEGFMLPVVAWNLRDNYIMADNGTQSVQGFLAAEMHLMQYTGLKDKNGTEIYESDYLQDLSNSKVFLVKWVDAGFNILSGDNYLVVGNEYEDRGKYIK